MRARREGKTLRYERHLRHSIDKVWFVLTDEVTFAFDPKPPGAAEVAAGWYVSLDWLAKRLTPGSPPTTLAELKALEASYQQEA